MRYGMRQLSHLALVTISAVSVFFLLVAIATAGHPPLWALVAYFLVAFFCFGVIFGNITQWRWSRLAILPVLPRRWSGL